MRNTYKIFVNKPEWVIGMTSITWDDNIMADLKEKVWEDVDWIHLAQAKDQWRALKLYLSVKRERFFD